MRPLIGWFESRARWLTILHSYAVTGPIPDLCDAGNAVLTFMIFKNFLRYGVESAPMVSGVGGQLQF